MKEKIVFLTHTNYHLLMTFSIIFDKYSDINKYEVIVIKSIKESEESIEPKISNINLIYLDLQEKHNVLNSSVINYFNEITRSNVKRFFFFNEDVLSAIYLAIRLKSNGAITGLIQDGLKAYAIIDKLALKYRLMRTIKFYKFLKSNNLKISSFYFFNIKYGRSSVVDELWLTHPESSILKTKPSLKINFFDSRDDINSLKKIFKFDYNVSNSKVIFFISSIVRDNTKVIETEKKIINDLSNKFPDAEIYFKVHPRTPSNVIDKVILFPKVKIINSEAPAEFYISQFDKAIILGSYSTALLYNNNKSSYYWLYPMYQKYIPTFKYTYITNPTSHIKISDNIENIEF